MENKGDFISNSIIEQQKGRLRVELPLLNSVIGIDDVAYG